MLGLSIRGTHIHSTLPLGATRAQTSQSEMNPYSAIGGKELPPTVERASRDTANVCSANSVHDLTTCAR
jgi:hypothetical protein